MKVLIYGSTYVSAVVSDHLLKKGFDLVGYVPSVNPVFFGQMPIPEVTEKIESDIKLSIQYDRKIEDVKNAFNLHTGLLPKYGGFNVLYHAIKNGATEQGLTFHRMTQDFDRGEIISQISYPILPTDRVVDLYRKMVQIAPVFTELCLSLLDWRGNIKDPQIYHRGDIDPEESSCNIVDIKNFIQQNDGGLLY